MSTLLDKENSTHHKGFNTIEMCAWNSAGMEPKFSKDEYEAVLVTIKNNEKRYEELCRWNNEGNTPKFTEAELFSIMP